MNGPEVRFGAFWAPFASAPWHRAQLRAWKSESPCATIIGVKGIAGAAAAEDGDGVVVVLVVLLVQATNAVATDSAMVMRANDVILMAEMIKG
jgi:hypothetical protein